MQKARSVVCAQSELPTLYRAVLTPSFLPECNYPISVLAQPDGHAAAHVP